MTFGVDWIGFEFELGGLLALFFPFLSFRLLVRVFWVTFLHSDRFETGEV